MERIYTPTMGRPAQLASWSLLLSLDLASGSAGPTLPNREVVVPPSRTAECASPVDREVGHVLAAAGYVFEGTVIDTELRGSANPAHLYRQEWVRLRVSRVWKGWTDPVALLRNGSENKAIAPFTPGQAYLVFAKGAPPYPLRRLTRRSQESVQLRSVLDRCYGGRDPERE